MSASDTIEMIRRIIADDTADLRERIQHLEKRTDGLADHGSNGRAADLGHLDSPPEPQVDHAQIDELQARLDEIQSLHRLDATPVQYTRDPNGGKMVEAPEGLWELTCLACNHHTYFQEGDNRQPPQCKTWMLANGSESKRH